MKKAYLIIICVFIATLLLGACGQTVAVDVDADEIAVDNIGSDSEIATAWMDTWLAQHKALPRNSQSHIEDYSIDSIEIRINPNVLGPDVIYFRVYFSVKTDGPIMANDSWMPGNTKPHPEDDTWGQIYREVELRLGDDGRYHLDEIGTGG